ncbi:uncharacterized protein PF3D7_1120600-like [Metopolophium dirhodum]|uniref:uncharacterized protein PF3D7_1120600-like n=1 Tax=Metopolophium dirhodum TaxID=44670 RepID=UPI00299012FF|nr:uncharacterized protein PF3D7_1120600-like [Metopolophium dirhodum]
MLEDVIMTNNVDSEEKKEKEGHNEEKDLNGDFENNTEENNKREMDDYKNKQLMKIDDENNDKVNKNTAETNKEEKDNGDINKLKEIDNVSNIENHVENKNPLVILDDEEDDNVAKSIEKNAENDIFENMNNITENKITVIVENNKEEKDNGAINKLKEIDNVSNIENHVENEIPLVILDNEEDDNTLTIKVVEKKNTNQIEIDGEKNTTFTVTKPLEINDIVEKKIKNNAVDEQLKEIDTVVKSIEKNAENDIFENMNNTTENKITVIVENNKEEKDNGAINKLKEIDNVSNIENHVENEIPLVIIDNEEDDNTLTIKVVEKKNTNQIEIDGEKNTTFTVTKPLEVNDIVEKKIKNNTVDEQLKEIDTVAKSIEKNAENDIFENMNNTTENKITVENNKEEKDNGAINKLKEINNVSNIKNHVVNENPLAILDGEEDDNTLTIENVKNWNTNLIEIDCDNDTTSTNDSSEELELGENMIKNGLLPKDNEQKSENNADKKSDEREIKLVECNDDSEEEISKKRKNDQEEGPRKRTKSH